MPFYLNGTLSEEDQAFVEAYFSQNPSARDELNFSRAIREYSKNISGERPADAGLETVLLKYRALKKAPSRLSKLREWCSEWGLSPAFAVAAAIAAIQAAFLMRPVVVPVGSSAEDLSAYRGIHVPTTALTADLKVSPSPNATYADLATLFSLNHCQVVHGPDAEGALWLKATDPRADLEGIAIALKKSSEIDSAAVVKEEKLPKNNE